ncbi:MAG: hypothetical protein PHP45_09680 [Elusimicrobiales bacterium]|nr:hypothetical protein [Elusimicrobiales bacterium]
MLKNSGAAALSEIERLSVESLRGRIGTSVWGGGVLLSLFALPLEGVLHLCAVLGDRKKSDIELLLAPVEGTGYPAITASVHQAHLFEREIAEQYDIRPEGHPWLKPVRFHEPYRKGAGVFGAERPGPAVWDYFRMKGEEIHEVAVGPVHAGIIEPGHFRFQCHGENVYHLEIQLGFQHRGIERATLANPARRLFYMETAAGDTTAAHATAYCRVVEALSDCKPSPRAEAARAIALELERLANHTGDMGALAGDVGYLPTMSFCGRIRGDFLNMTALLCGSRFGRGLLEEGGTRFDITPAIAAELSRRLDAAQADVAGAVGLLWKNPSVLARFEGTGAVSAETAAELGLVGPAARACGLKIDARTDFPSGHYLAGAPETVTLETGDVYARAMVRWLEMQQSLDFIRRTLPAAQGDTGLCRCGAFKPESAAVCVEEGWRGELCHVAFTDKDGKLSHYKITDPSFKNWTGLALALRGQQISDFPLCNKSFNLSYCGVDL